ncbi:hypothetical protein FPCIR_11582 [Fusarium pseudocircinatum]|uniref:Uncharacterized protein n=1 Tax=Fusarium pseudocircinatum TaxID=56676 RepID=A0A8H5NTN5_9HYPO|nr:hypothetical protein FPCIR_11582 [Fusarium pseudocircinatum]
MTPTLNLRRKLERSDLEKWRTGFSCILSSLRIFDTWQRARSAFTQVEKMTVKTEKHMREERVEIKALKEKGAKALEKNASTSRTRRILPSRNTDEAHGYMSQTWKTTGESVSDEPRR